MAQIKEEVNVTNFLLLCITALVGLTYTEIKTTVARHEIEINQLKIDVAVLDQKYFEPLSKKKPISCNFRQYLCVQCFYEKKDKKKDHITA